MSRRLQIAVLFGCLSGMSLLLVGGLLWKSWQTQTHNRNLADFNGALRPAYCTVIPQIDPRLTREYFQVPVHTASFGVSWLTFPTNQSAESVEALLTVLERLNTHPFPCLFHPQNQSVLTPATGYQDDLTPTGLGVMYFVLAGVSAFVACWCKRYSDAMYLQL